MRPGTLGPALVGRLCRKMACFAAVLAMELTKILGKRGASTLLSKAGSRDVIDDALSSLRRSKEHHGNAAGS
jgi:hypothetical protein